MSFCLIFIPHGKRNHTSESNITRVLFALNITSANLILYNSSVNMNILIVCFKNNIVCFCSVLSTKNITYKESRIVVHLQARQQCLVSE